MKKRKPYYIIIAIMCFISLAGVFLPYLKLSSDDVKENGYIIDFQEATLESNLVAEIAKETNKDEKVIENIVKGIIKGRDEEKLAKDLDDDEIYIIDTVRQAMNDMAGDIEKADAFKETEFSFFSLIKLSVTIIKSLEQDFVNASLLIFTLITNIILALAAGVHMLITKGDKSYRFVRITSFINIVLATIGFLCINAIGIGALQIDKFTKGYWGSGFYFVVFLNAAIWLIATIASIHSKVEGFVTWKIIMKQNQLILMSLPFIIYALVFYYSPLLGWTMAFQNYKPALKGDQAWIAWDKFQFLFSNGDFLNVFRNTVSMSLINLVLSFIFSIGFALLLNEVVNIKGKKFVQTVSYLPHFLSWIIVTGIVSDVLSMETGIINDLLTRFNFIDTPINFFANSDYFWWIVGFSNVWKETGWGSIIYLSAITAINPDLYEAASIDGAGRLKKMLHITLPSIKPTIFILLIINIGNIMNSGFEVQYLLGNGLVQDVSQTIDIYVLKYGISLSDYSLGTAAGIFKSVVSIILIFLANRFAKSVGEESLF